MSSLRHCATRCALLHGVLVSGTMLALVLALDGCQERVARNSVATSAIDSTLPRPFVFGEVRNVHSKVLGEERTLNIRLPEGYNDTTLAYPVICVLDGSANEDFPHIAGLVQFMNMYALLPGSIVVGIANVDRQHDLTPATQSDSDRVWIPTHGGADAFIRFLDEEALPFIDSTFRTNGTRTIIGQSLGGLFCIHLLFERPALFDRYVIVSPSLWWNNGALAAGAGQWLHQHATLSKRVFLAMGSEGTEMQAYMDQLLAGFRSEPRAALQWTYEHFPAENHATILHRAVYRAFEVLGDGVPPEPVR